MGKRIVKSVVEKLQKEVRSEAKRRGTERVEKHFRTGESRFMPQPRPVVGNRSRISAAVSLSTIIIGPPHLGQDQRSLGLAEEVSCSVCGARPSSWKQSGKVVACLRLARKPKLRMRTKPSGEQVQQEAAQELIER